MSWSRLSFHPWRCIAIQAFPSIIQSSISLPVSLSVCVLLHVCLLTLLQPKGFLVLFFVSARVSACIPYFSGFFSGAFVPYQRLSIDIGFCYFWSFLFSFFHNLSFLCLSVCPPLCPIAYLHLIVGFLGYMWSYSSFAHLRESCSFHVCLTDMKWMHAAERRTHICLYLCLSACLFLSLSLRNKPFYPSVHPNFDLDAVAICKDI